MTLRPMTFILIAIAMSAAGAASAQTMQMGTSVTMVRTGWNADAFAIVTLDPVVNPAGCSIADGYVSDKTLPGYQTYYAAALTAIATRLPVDVTVHNTECVGGRPKLIGINLHPGP